MLNPVDQLILRVPEPERVRVQRFLCTWWSAVHDKPRPRRSLPTELFTFFPDAFEATWSMRASDLRHLVSAAEPSPLLVVSSGTSPYVGVVTLDRRPAFADAMTDCELWPTCTAAFYFILPPTLHWMLFVDTTRDVQINDEVAFYDRMARRDEDRFSALATEWTRLSADVASRAESRPWLKPGT